jgi:phosphate transport system permease protein
MPDLSPAETPPTTLLRRGFSADRLIRYFFASNAGLTLVILLLIIAFLLKEGLGFFPGYRRELEIYRLSGMEFVDLSRVNQSSHEQLASLFNRAYYAEINGRADRELRRTTESMSLVADFEDFTAPPRDSYLAVVKKGSVTQEVMKRIKERYQELLPKAVSMLPPTPSLSADERRSIIDDLLSREIENDKVPALAAQLADEYAIARETYAQPLRQARARIDAFEEAGHIVSRIVDDLTAKVKSSQQALAKADRLERDRATLLEAAAENKNPAEREKLLKEAEKKVVVVTDIHPITAALMEKKAECEQAHKHLRDVLSAMQADLSFDYQQAEARKLQLAIGKAMPVYLSELETTPERLRAWDASRPVPLSDAVISFLTDKRWLTGGEWQDFYGILPLLIGSLMIGIVALTIAIPMGIGAAIYTNQFASKREKKIIKPVIEFIQAIPSVVLGFIGIFIIGEPLRELSTMPFLSWMPGFPIEERLNIFTAGCLLALMSMPTIFSLAEDALHHVPSAYAEASEALGATKLQTTFGVVVPAAFSGILAAVLLGFGRVIGETMVVLLVAGNRINIPDFTAGIGAFFQPVHTMTGIIAQELGEVPAGSVHYRALFMVAMLLFAIVMGINSTARHFTRNIKH